MRITVIGSFLFVLAIAVLSAPVRGSSGEDERYRIVVEAILALWEGVDFVCLGEQHGSKLDSDLRLALVRHPRFPETVNVVVVEFANPIHQGILDSLVLDGSDVGAVKLSRVWRDTSAPRVWDSPVYEEFIRAVAETNRAAPAGRRVRIVGAAVPIDWQNVSRPEDLLPLANRGGALGGAAEKAVLMHEVKGLGIYGARNCEYRGGFGAVLRYRYPDRIHVIVPLFGSGIETARGLFDLGKAPSLIPVVGTERSQHPALPMFFAGRYDDQSTLGQVTDSIVYHGHVEDHVVHADPSIYEGEYGEELKRRERLYLGFAEMQRRPRGETK